MHALWTQFTTWLAWEERHYLRRRHLADLLAVLLLLGLMIGFFWRTVSGDVYQPADGGDLVSFLYPTYRFAAAQLQQGILPLWNPTLYAGAPFIGDIQAGFLYVPNLILFWLWPNFDYEVMQWFVIGHLCWAALGMYVLLRAWSDAPPLRRLSRGAALFGALAFALSDPFLIHLGNLNLIAVLSWLPWILAAYHKALYHHSLRWAAIAGFLFSLANFAGHAQSTFYIGMILALFTLGHWALKASEWRSAHKTKTVSLPRVIAVLQYPLITATLTILLTAPILLPAMELARFTERDSFTYQDTVAYSLAPAQVIGVFTPGFFGRGPALHWSLWSRVELPYAGVATLILALSAIALVTPATRQRLWVWVLIGGAGFATALGIYGIVHGWLTWLLPIFDQFRAPARALVLWSFALAVLASIGFDIIRHGSKVDIVPNDGNAFGEAFVRGFLRWGAIGLAGIATPLLYLALLLTQENETAFLRASVALLAVTVAAGFWLATWALIAMRRARWLSSLAVAALLVILLFFDLAATGAYTDISPTAPTRGYEHPALLDTLRNEPMLGRIDTLTDIQNFWQPDSAALYDLEDVGGIANPLILDHWQQLWEALGGRGSRLYDMLHVTHIIVRDGTPLPDGKFELQFDAPGELALYRNTAALNRAWLVHDVQYVATPAEAFARLTAEGFDPTTTAIVQGATDLTLATAAATATEQVQIVDRTVNSLTLINQASAPALLVLSEIWYPGWRATIDGEPVPILRTNGALRGIPVPTGTSRVEMEFSPDSWRTGLLAAVAGWVLLIIIFIFEKTPKRQRANSSE
ncbi:MAG TPA: YfhO family protein [Caldilineaceae bacterium]|nr:YfhO family protein [Caldilineaceae bacterium]